ncbi:MAG: YbaB/EbfC family nucleoid-associated protein [Coxiellaceae bacterium]|nr:MAG: YbaB/EbfC family nucleoid-associated protein [Coxiellaceae bacterium]
MAETPKPSLTELMESAKKMQDSMQKAQQRIAKLELKGVAGGGLVSVTMTGDHKVKQFHISQEALDEGTEVLEDLCKAACNDALARVEKAAQEEMMKITKELGLPDMPA